MFLTKFFFQQQIIIFFAHVPEPEFEGHVILEQYQAQVGAALRPAFSPETAPHVTAAACEVCSRWIGSGVARDLNDLRRVHQLLASSLAKLKQGEDQTPLFSESATTMEQLAVLHAWAEVYVEAMKQEKMKSPNKSEDNYSGGESLLSLVQPEMSTLSEHWLNALKDYALLSLPAECSSQLPSEGGAFYKADTMDGSKIHYKKAWPPILYAVSLWLHDCGFTTPTKRDDSRPANMKSEDPDGDRLHLLIGICMEALCSPSSIQPEQTVEYCLRTMFTLLDDPWPRSRIGAKPKLSIEILNVMHRLLLTRESESCFVLVIQVVKQVVKAAIEHTEQERAAWKEQHPDPETPPKNQPEVVKSSTQIAEPGEGGSTGDIYPAQSVIFATLETCLCVFMRYVPDINPSSTTNIMRHLAGVRKGVYSEDACKIMSDSLSILADMPQLCSPKGTTSVIPTLIFLTLSVMRELAPRNGSEPVWSISSALHTLKSICSSPFAKRLDDIGARWRLLLQSALYTLLQDYEPSQDKPGMHYGTALLAMTVFLKNSGRDTLNVDIIQEKTVKVFREAWATNDSHIQLQSIQAAMSIFQHPDKQVAIFFIHSIAPPVIESLLQASSDRESNNMEPELIFKSVQLVETLIALTEEDENRIHLVSVLVPVLYALLIDTDRLRNADKSRKIVHEYAIQKLKEVGLKYLTHFRTVIQKTPQLKARLEEAIKAQESANQTRHLQQSSNGSQPATVVQPSKPTIQLRQFGSGFASRS